jgi:hypothetical protein
MLSPLCAEIIPHPSSGFFPHDKISDLRDNPRMVATTNFDEVMARIERKLDQHGFTERDASLKATGKPDLIRDMRRRRGLPNSDRLKRLAGLLGTTTDWLLDGGEEGEAEMRAESARAIVRSEVRGTGLHDVEQAWRSPSPSRPVPLVGSAVGGTANGIDEHVELTELHLGEVLDYLSRPVSLAKDPQAYAVTHRRLRRAAPVQPGDDVSGADRARCRDPPGQRSALTRLLEPWRTRQHGRPALRPLPHAVLGDRPVDRVAGLSLAHAALHDRL